MREKYKIFNVKFHFSIKKYLKNRVIKETDILKFKTKFWGNYHTVKTENKVVFSYFSLSGKVNVTGVKNFSQIPEILRKFNNVFGVKIRIKDVKIDCTTASGNYFEDKSQLEKRESTQFIDLPEIKQYIENNLLLSKKLLITLYPRYFPSCVIRFKVEPFPTILLFSSGKFNIVGGKTNEKIKHSAELLFSVLDKYFQNGSMYTSGRVNI